MNDASTKVAAHHLRRHAYLYVRQSSLYQVANNTESTRRQYDLRSRAVALGWSAERVVVIDVDQGQSGASAADREGFQRLVADVSLGKAGIVLGLECSRLARNNADWHRLLQLCSLTNTLICDEDGLYDPGAINDRLLLGLKGTMSEAELHFLRARLQGGILAKAARGELALRLPVGFVYDACESVLLDHDAGVREAISHFFATFEATGSATAVVKAFIAEGLGFPGRHSGGPHAGELYWVPLRHDHALFVLHNPRYAGAYVYGRHRDVTDVDGRTHTVAKPRAEWTVFIPGAHAGYISLEQFEANQATLAANAAARGEDRRAGPPREGPALLQGLVVCGRCGRRMTVKYHKRANGSLLPDYSCQQEGIATGAAPCQTVCGAGVDAAVGALVLEQLSPLAIEAALAVSAELAGRAAEADRVRAATVERARYAAEAARRRYLAVDPANRLVASTLEADWNHKLRELADAQDDYDRAARAGAAPLDEAQRARVRALGLRPPRALERSRHPHARAQAAHPAPGHRRHPPLRRRAHHRPRPSAGRGLPLPHAATAAASLGGPHDAAGHSGHDRRAAGRPHHRRGRGDPQRSGSHGWLGQALHGPLPHRAVQGPRHPRPAPAVAGCRHAHRGRDGGGARRHDADDQEVAAPGAHHRPADRRAARVPLRSRPAPPFGRTSPPSEPHRRDCHTCSR